MIKNLRPRSKSLVSVPSRPVFVIGCPRSGTTLLFELLRQHPDLASLASEAHVLWNAYQHPCRKDWSSDSAAAHDIEPGEPEYVYEAIRSIAGSRRFLDKTPKNVLKIPYLERLFPDATYVFLKRDARSTVASLIEGWRARHGISYRLPVSLLLDEYHGRLWSYVLPPGWRELRRTSIADVAAAQYVTSNEHGRRELSQIPSERVVEVKFEDLLQEPLSMMEFMMERLGLARNAAVFHAAEDLSSRQVATVSPPKPNKWRIREQEISRVWPQLLPTMQHLGYPTPDEP